MKIEKHNIVYGKMDYARGKRPRVDCILCAVAAGDPLVEDLRVFQGEAWGEWFVTLNLYPYNPGHVMIVPRKHFDDVRQLDGSEALELHRIQVLTLRVLDRVYKPAGYNIGYNLGQAAGASIEHLHLQVVPRYRTELGFFDIVSDSRVIVEEPKITRERLQAAFVMESKAAEAELGKAFSGET